MIFIISFIRNLSLLPLGEGFSPSQEITVYRTLHIAGVFRFLQKSLVGSEDGGWWRVTSNKLFSHDFTPLRARLAVAEHARRTRRSIKAVQCKPQAPFVVRKPEAHRGRRRTRLCLLYFRWHGTRYRSSGIPRPRNPEERSARHRRARRLVQDSRANCWDTWSALGPFIGHAILISHARLCGMCTPCPNSIWIPWVRCPRVRKTGNVLIAVRHN